MEGIEHRMISANGLNIHIAEKGQGPLVLFLHGFPKLWYSWRHQIHFMASHGYHAVAPDLRGYGDTTGAPVDDPSKFSILHIVGDIVALLDVIAPNEKVFVVAHDWGAHVAWDLNLFRPDKVKALVALSVYYIPRNPSGSVVDLIKAFYGEDHYAIRFQKPGDMEDEIANNFGTKTFLKKFMSHRETAPFFIPKGTRYDGDSPLPSWLAEEDLDYYTTKYEKTGFTGPMNYYRAWGLTWELTAPWTGAQEVVVMKGAGHFINEEKPDDVNKHILGFLQQF
ncbi:Epoxide hydrolase [Heracleum sosnowskyi]|uniref:Epoxide hydrolase n=1 Tax=Heracleum sosnowskyi TaxID=360622 RepID=A0AAD8IKE2_9APIA|nr:Epoxide hydrolase [Heracleum sosnowskyi]